MKDYEAPSIREIGSLADMTLGGSNRGQDVGRGGGFATNPSQLNTALDVKPIDPQPGS